MPPVDGDLRGRSIGYRACVTDINRRVARSVARRHASLNAVRAALTRLQIEHGLEVEHTADALSAQRVLLGIGRHDQAAVFDELINLLVRPEAASAGGATSSLRSRRASVLPERGPSESSSPSAEA